MYACVCETVNDALIAVRCTGDGWTLEAKGGFFFLCYEASGPFEQLESVV